MARGWWAESGAVKGDANSPEFRKVLESAAAEADRLGQPDIDVLHLLPGLLCASQSAAAVMIECGMSLEEARRQAAGLGTGAP